MKAGKPMTSPSISGCVNGLPPSPHKTVNKVWNPCLELTPLMDQADDASDFLNWNELPLDVHEKNESPGG